jgi:hypothetical protein
LALLGGTPGLDLALARDIVATIGEVGIEVRHLGFVRDALLGLGVLPGLESRSLDVGAGTVDFVVVRILVDARGIDGDLTRFPVGQCRRHVAGPDAGVLDVLAADDSTIIAGREALRERLVAA